MKEAIRQPADAPAESPSSSSWRRRAARASLGDAPRDVPPPPPFTPAEGDAPRDAPPPPPFTPAEVEYSQDEKRSSASSCFLPIRVPESPATVEVVESNNRCETDQKEHKVDVLPWDRVEAQCPGWGPDWHPGVVRQLHPGGLIEVLWDGDACVSHVSSGMVRRAFQLGDKVNAYWGADAYPGMVQEILANGNIQVLWDDECSVSVVSLAQVILRFESLPATQLAILRGVDDAAFEPESANDAASATELADAEA